MPPKIFPVKSEKNKKFSSRATNSNNRHTLHIRPNKLDVSAGTGKSTISRDRTGGKQADEQDILLLLSEFTAKGRRLHLRQKHETDESAGLNKQPPPPPPPPPLEEIGAEDELDIAEDNREKEVDVVEVIDRDDYSDYEGGGESGEPSWRRDYESRSGKKRRIDSWRTGKAPRVDSWQTLPDEDLPPSERDYEETEEQDTIKVEGKESKDSSDDDLHSRPNPSDMVATTGSRIAHQIGLDLYDESPVSNYLGWLLDKLDRQANELRYWREGGRSRSPSVTRTERSKPPSLKEEIKPRIPKHQVLHRVQCRLNNHRHTSGRPQC